MDEFNRLMRSPRLCRCCGRRCNGLRCRKCHSITGAIIRALTDAPNGRTEEEIGQIVSLEKMLRGQEAEGRVHETPEGWVLGLHPDQAALIEAWQARAKKAAPHV